MYFQSIEDELLRKKSKPSSFLVKQHKVQEFKIDYNSQVIEYVSKEKKKTTVMLKFDDIYAYNLYENHKEKSIVK